jgi:hypothetical protein
LKVFGTTGLWRALWSSCSAGLWRAFWPECAEARSSIGGDLGRSSLDVGDLLILRRVCLAITDWARFKSATSGTLNKDVKLVSRKLARGRNARRARRARELLIQFINKAYTHFYIAASPGELGGSRSSGRGGSKLGSRRQARGRAASSVGEASSVPELSVCS